MDLKERIISLLAPAVGDFLAKAKLKAALNMARVDEITPSNLDIVAQKIALTMVRAVGQNTAKEIEIQIKSLAA